MAISQMTDNLDIIAALDNEPNDVGGLTATELKETFDRSGNLIKTYLNDTLIPDTEAEINAVVGGVVLGQIPDNSLTEEKLDSDLQAKVNGALTPEDAFTKDQVLGDEVRLLYGLTDSDTPSTLLKRQRTVLLGDSYTQAGSYTWTAPKSGRVHALIVGGGGSGCALTWRYSVTTDRYWTGGAAGCVALAIFDVAEGDEIPIVVGTGGEGVTFNMPSGTSNLYGGFGNAGGTSSCNGTSALGGGGGNDGSSTSYYSNYGGGQLPDQTVEYTINPQLPYGGILNYPGSYTTVQGICYTLVYGRPRNVDLTQYCKPDGTPVVSLAAGGSTYGRYNSNATSTYTTAGRVQSAPTLPSGNTASASVGGVYGVDTEVEAVPGTDPGCGGGAALAVSSMSVTTTSLTATSAPGNEGAVFLFWEVEA